MTNYNKEQQSAITYPAKPLLIIAGAGTGKTTTIVGRMAHLIQKDKAQPGSILALTFTNDAAKNLKNKLANNIGARGNDIHALTFHAFAQLQTMKYFQKLGYSYLPKVMNRGDIYFLIRRRFDDLDTLRSKTFRRNPTQAIQSFQKTFEAFRYNLLNNQELKKLQKTELDKIPYIDDDKEKEQIYQLADMVDVFPQYQNWKKEENWIDYGDMIINLWELIQHHNNILNKLQNQYKHIIVDEFQDNNYGLSKIMGKIAMPGNSITVVGDDDQCIYAFRQANVQNVHQFKTRYYTNKQVPISLMQNYRSYQSILDIANSVIAHNEDRINKGKLLGNRHDKLKPKLYIGSENQQLEKITEIVTALLQEGECPRNIAILMRSHVKCRLASEFLNLNGIRTYYSADKLYEQPVVKDVLALLNIWGETEKSEHGFLRLLRNQLGEETIAFLTNKYIYEKSKIRLIEYAISQNNKTGEVARDIMNAIRHINTQDTAMLLWNLLKIGKMYHKPKLQNHTAKKEWHALNRFRDVLDAYCKTYLGKDPHGFISFINIQWEVNDEPLTPLDGLADFPAIRIMTIHNAKGMEFKHVFIPFLRAGTFPHRYEPMTIVDRLPISWQRWDVKGKDEKELHFEEERRLFYVAITRAMETLTLLAPTKYQSTFIKEINKEQIIIEDIMNSENIVQLSDGREPSLDNNPRKIGVTDTLKKNKAKIPVKQISLSATSIDTYNNCPLKYKYRYVDNIPEAPEKTYFQLGKVIHKILELFHKNKRSSFGDLINLLDTHWKNGDYQYKQEREQNREDAEIMLKNYWNYIQLNPVNTLYTEHWFSFNTRYANLKGKCDRIDLDDEKNITIIDYKTSKKPKTEMKLKKDIQLGIYAIFSVFNGIKLENNILKAFPKKLSKLFLRESEPEVSVVFTTADIDQFAKKIKEVAENIQKGKFEPCKGRYCDWCDYKELLCPEFG